MFVITKSLTKIAVITILFSCSQAPDKTREPVVDHKLHETSASITGYADSVNNGLITTDSLKGSPARTAMLTMGKTHVHISYHSPGVKGRIIWGGLVPYRSVWVTGAHSATSITINQPIEINNQKIDTGTYAIFTIPDEKEWTFILNKNYKQHLADEYLATEDVLSMKTIPKTNAMTQRLTFQVTALSENSGEISMAWEKLKISIPFKVLN